MGLTLLYLRKTQIFNFFFLKFAFINYLCLYLQKNNMSNFKTILISFFVGAVAYAIFGKKIATDSPLESYRLEGRVICDRYPQAMRDLPEIYGDADFFASSYR